MAEFYHNLITEKSFKILQDLRRNYDFILIGGWAVFLYTKVLKSKDLDLILEYDELAKMKEKFSLVKNERLKRYEIKIEEIDIDLYLPYYSKLGLPVEEIKNYIDKREGFKVPKPEILLILKLAIFEERKGTPKSEKDKIDIISLLKDVPIDFKFYKKVLKDYRLENFNEKLAELLKHTNQVLELNLNQDQYSRFKKIILEKTP